MKTKAFAVEELARRRGIVRVRDLAGRSLPISYLSRLERQGRLIRHGRGVYAPADLEISATHDWELACLRVPSGVLCLLSALAYHRIGTQNPAEVWMAIGVKARKPRIDYPPMHFVRFSGVAQSHGIVTTKAGPVTLRVYAAAKTVADCFKYRNKLGIDVAIEALREGWREKKFTRSELHEAAEVCRVRRIMRPYLEMLA